MNYCIQMLIAGAIKDIEIQNIEALILCENGLLISLLIFKNFLSNEFESFVEFVNSSILVTEHAAKKIKKNEDSVDIKNIEVWNSRPQEYFLFNFMKNVVNNRNKQGLLFFYSLSNNSHLESLVPKVSDTEVFQTIIGAQQPQTIESLVYCFTHTNKPINLLPFFNRFDIIDVCALFAMIPMHILQFGNIEAEEYLNSVLKLFFQSGFDVPSLELYSFKGIGAQVTIAIKNLIRLIQFSDFFESKKGPKTAKFFIGNDGVCCFCGEDADKFCFSCGKINVPIVYPAEALNFILPLENVQFFEKNIEMADVKCLKNFNFPMILKKIIKKVESLDKKHSCLNIIENTHFCQLVIFLKFLDCPCFSLPVNCITVPLCSVSEELEKIKEHPLYSKIYSNKVINSLSLKDLNFEILKFLIQNTIWPCKTESAQSLTVTGIKLLKSKFNISLNEALCMIEDDVLLR